MRFKWILFDADGTLFDYDKAEQNALGNTFNAFGKEMSDDYLATYRKINRQIWKQLEAGLINQEQLKHKRFEVLAGSLNLDLDAYKASSIYLKNLSRQTEIIPGAYDLLLKLQGKAGLVIITNGLTEVQRPRFRDSILYPFFDHIIISEEVGAAKPQPEIFDITFDRMGMPPRKEVLIIGDNLNSDIRGGLEYNIATCWFNPHSAQPHDGVTADFEISALHELLAIVGAD